VSAGTQASSFVSSRLRGMRLSPARARRRDAFTLMEINIALLLVAIALAALLTLMPTGLRQSDLATSDTAQAAFATSVFNAMHANASTMVNWTNWMQFTDGADVLQNVTAPSFSAGAVPISAGVHEIEDHLVEHRYVKYELGLQNGVNGSEATNSLVKRAWIRSTDRRFANVAESPIYVTAFVYMGM